MKPEKSQRSQGLPPEEERRTQIALFRYGLIASLLNRPLERGEIGAHFKARRPNPPHSFLEAHHRRRETLWRYLARYRKRRLRGPQAQARADKGKPAHPRGDRRASHRASPGAPTRSATTLIQILRRDPVLPSRPRPLASHSPGHPPAARCHPREALGPVESLSSIRAGVGQRPLQGDMLVGPYLPDVERPGKYRRTALFCFIDDYSKARALRRVLLRGVTSPPGASTQDRSPSAWPARCPLCR